jgi:hypothetical protein
MPSSPIGKKPAKKQALAERSLNSPDVAIPKLADTSKRVGGKMKLAADGKVKPRAAAAPAAAAVPMAHRSIEMIAGKRTAGTAQAATRVDPCILCGKSGFESQVQMSMHVQWCLEQHPPASRGADGALGDQDVARRNNHASAEESSHSKEGAGDLGGCSSKQKQREALEGQTSGMTKVFSSSRQGASTSNNSKTVPSGGTLKGRDVGGSVKQSTGIAHTTMKQHRQQPTMEGRSSTKEGLSSSKRLGADGSSGNAEKSGRGGGRLALNKGVRAVDHAPGECAADGMGELKGREGQIRGGGIVEMSAVRVEKDAGGGGGAVEVDVAPTCRVGDVLKGFSSVAVAEREQRGATGADACRQVGDAVAPAKDGDRRAGGDFGASRLAASASSVGKGALIDQVVAGVDVAPLGVEGGGQRTPSKARRGHDAPVESPTVAEGECVKGKKRRLQLNKATTPSSKKQQQQQQPESPLDRGEWVSSASPAAMGTQGSAVAGHGNGAIAAQHGGTSYDEKSTLLPRSLELELLGMGVVELRLPIRGGGWLGEDWREELVREGSREGRPTNWIQVDKRGDATSSSSSSSSSSRPSAPDFDFMDTGSGWGELATCVARPFVIT